jgi:hypothetical protein
MGEAGRWSAAGLSTATNPVWMQGPTLALRYMIQASAA